METDKTLTFNECLEIATHTRGPKHLILGNGFSISLFPDIFNYKKLAEKISDQRIKDIFKELKTTDFEFVMRGLLQTLVVLNFYPDAKDIIKKIQADLDDLKKI
ncbi:MAG TPA: DUF4917 family protein [Alphaproteobacteria bacterium]|nr:DUF4917 family protein [Alphaproteobacteria bacterium]